MFIVDKFFNLKTFFNKPVVVVVDVLAIFLFIYKNLFNSNINFILLDFSFKNEHFFIVSNLFFFICAKLKKHVYIQAAKFKISSA